MPCGSVLLFFALTLLQVFSLTISQPKMLYKDCVGLGNYTTNSTYQTNLNTLLTSIYSNTEIDYGFYNFTYGESPDRVYAIALCRPDISAATCRECIRNASSALLTLCPNNKEAIGGYDDCMLRYTFRAVFNLYEGGPYFWVYRETNTTDFTGFNRTLNTLLASLWDRAALGDSRYKYAYGQNGTSNLQTIYALVQCTPDLTGSECRDCLYNASGLLPQCCTNRNGGRVIFPSCNFRYEVDRFYNLDGFPSPPPPPGISEPPSPPPPPPPGNTNKTRTAIIVVVSVAVPLGLAILIFVCFKRKKKTDFEGVSLLEVEEAESLQFDFNTIKVATNDFSEANKLGQGGFGSVYKGALPNGQEIAVKRLARESGQGEKEFKNEVLLVAKLQHRNLVRLLGFGWERNERLLVYEFLPNLSLDTFIFDPTRRGQLDWETRYKIIGGIARGMLYLHEESRLRIIHRDLKASNVLLDKDCNAKIADFGMARLVAVDQTHDSTHKIVGTFGYMAPEYVRHGHFSVKSDVFSFGVLVLEIVSGQKQSHFRSEDDEDLLSYAWKNWNSGTASNVMDPRLMVTTTRNEVERCIQVGLLCVQESEAQRPTMAQVNIMFSTESVTLSVPGKPGFFVHNALDPIVSVGSTRTSTNPSNNEVSISELTPR